MNINKSILSFFILLLCVNKAFSATQKTETAYLAAGCFWGVEEYFRKYPGVTETEVGYMGGKVVKPVYDAVSEGKTGHAETVRIVFDPSKSSFEKILIDFFKMHDPTTKNKQGNDVGTQYRSAIFPSSSEQKNIAEKVIKKIDQSKAWKAKLSTTIEDSKDFYPAEKEHQKYLVKNPGGYDNHFVRKLSFD